MAKVPAAGDAHAAQRIQRSAESGRAPQAGRGQEPGRAPPAAVAVGRADGRPGPAQRAAAGDGAQQDYRRRDGDHRHSRPGGHGPRRADDRTAPWPHSPSSGQPAPAWQAAGPREAVGYPGERRVTGFRFPGRFPGPDRRGCRRLLAALGMAVTGELAAVGLLATGAHVLLPAAPRPPILLLSIAIGAVQVLSLLRGTARYAERLASHSVGLGLQAGLRTWLYRCLERLPPAGGPRAGPRALSSP